MAFLFAWNVAAQDGMEMRYLVRQGSVALGVNPLTASARKAFYEARGFTATAIRPYAEACGFSFGMQNATDRTIRTALSDWHAVDADGARITLTLPEAWDAQWDKAGMPSAARIAFKWAQFQTSNVFEPGDWIMGMATLKSVPKAPFRLVARYQDNKGDHELVLDKLECAYD
ncbi:MAG: hypothetical protein AB1443_00625 [Pseudomonadota bacterium]